MKVTKSTTIESLVDNTIFAMDVFDSSSEKLLYTAKISITHADKVLKILGKSNIVEMDGQFQLKQEEVEALTTFLQIDERDKIEDFLRQKDINVDIFIGVFEM